MINLYPAISSLSFPGVDDVLFWLYIDGYTEGIIATQPTFCIDGERIKLPLRRPQIVEQSELFAGVQESIVRFSVLDAPHLQFDVIVRTVDISPVVRFRYRLHSQTPIRLTKPDGADDLTYFDIVFKNNTYLQEIRLSEFNPLFHSFMPVETFLPNGEEGVGTAAFGPLIAARNERSSALVAYEHGSQVPDTFLNFVLQEPDDPGDGDRRVRLQAVKGNYHDGQVIEPGRPFESVWFQAAVAEVPVFGLANLYREWVLKYQSPNASSRQPWIFYNTWNYQERVKHWQKRPYLADMNEERMLAEIEVAHRMGIDVFVIDTGWYEKTGDWRVSSARFPNGMAPIKAKLDEYEMKLGLWFNPTVAAVSSAMRRNHEDCLMTNDGKPHSPHEVWETEASQGLCLVSRYWEAFADELIRLNREVGVSYFKWDAIGQYGCDSGDHYHGGPANSLAERRDRYGFLLGTYMVKVVDKLCQACPEAIVDFDITEGGRTVGLQFLSAGKYFLINNGPYSHDYNMNVPADGNVNLFFFPGPARTWICRAPLTYDKWLPSILFLTHYLPDDSHHEWWAKPGELDGENQWLAIASLVLGQNGIWGDLCAISEDGIARFAQALGYYKQIRHDITEATLEITGTVGGSPEVYEKINQVAQKGVVSLFASTPGTYHYVTENQVLESVWHNDGVSIDFLPSGKAKVTATFKRGQYAKLVFFGIDA